MRRCAAMLALFSLGITAARADDCSSAVQAAFEKQRNQKGYHLVSKQQSERGEVETVRDYVAPDRMFNQVTVPGEPAPLQTIAVGRWAWGNQGGGWEELQPQFAQSVTSDVASALQVPVEIKDTFVCLGSVKRDGKEFAGYRTEPKAAPNAGEPALMRTVLIDADSGLPAHNIISEAKEGAAALLETAYTYPADITVEAPLDATRASLPH